MKMQTRLDGTKRNNNKLVYVVAFEVIAYNARHFGAHNFAAKLIIAFIVVANPAQTRI